MISIVSKEDRKFQKNEKTKSKDINEKNEQVSTNNFNYKRAEYFFNSLQEIKENNGIFIKYTKNGSLEPTYIFIEYIRWFNDCKECVIVGINIYLLTKDEFENVKTNDSGHIIMEKSSNYEITLEDYDIEGNVDLSIGKTMWFLTPLLKIGDGKNFYKIFEETNKDKFIKFFNDKIENTLKELLKSETIKYITKKLKRIVFANDSNNFIIDYYDDSPKTIGEIYYKKINYSNLIEKIILPTKGEFLFIYYKNKLKRF